MRHRCAGPKPSWLAGSLLDIHRHAPRAAHREPAAGDPLHARRVGMHVWHQQLAQKYGNVFVYFRGGAGAEVCVTSPKLVRSALRPVVPPRR